jgi:ribosomal protein S18 acetylase RimI-like enzyme
MAAPETAPVRPAALARSDELVELTHGLRRALLARGEFLPSTWVEESAADLRADRLVGWVWGQGAPTGLGFFSRRLHRAYAHVHVEPGPEPVRRAETLLRTVLESLPDDLERADAGVTGLSPAEEDELASHTAHWPGGAILNRLAMDATVTLPAPDEPLPTPPPFHLVGVREIPLAALAQLDWIGFHDTPDESLVAETVEEDGEVLTDILAGRLGRFLDEASTTLISDEGHLAAAILTAEQSPRRIVILDLIVHPAWRRRGLARFLLRYALRAGAALGYTDARLWVTETNAPARRLYDREGFHPGDRAIVYRFSRPVAPAGPHPHRDL